MESHEDGNKPVFERYYKPSLSELVENKSKHLILNSYWLLNRGKNNRRTFLGMAKVVAATYLSHLKGVLFTVLY